MKPLSKRGQQALREMIDLWNKTLNEETPERFTELLKKMH